ncbi:hypothetical protein E5Q_00837 [Mixia osmundae IAM 14324]|uniref:F-box domain-containing protein n=1 Tax=Mixia osmundae (strain CBS 9802 / IAM 14324 / JCM 22182 / KY 12970) TaxID=764103 RepID=G7DUC9_MIXOS|nr:hypothetical protein E5Q_00837 [Mixia osmundae IAM 14324]
MDQLPPEILLHVFAAVDSLHTLSRLALVCRLFAEIIDQHDAIYRGLASNLGYLAPCSAGDSGLLPLVSQDRMSIEEACRLQRTSMRNKAYKGCERAQMPWRTFAHIRRRTDRNWMIGRHTRLSLPVPANVSRFKMDSLAAEDATAVYSDPYAVRVRPNGDVADNIIIAPSIEGRRQAHHVEYSEGHLFLAAGRNAMHVYSKSAANLHFPPKPSIYPSRRPEWQAHASLDLPAGVHAFKARYPKVVAATGTAFQLVDLSRGTLQTYALQQTEPGPRVLRQWLGYVELDENHIFVARTSLDIYSHSGDLVRKISWLPPSPMLEQYWMGIHHDLNPQGVMAAIGLHSPHTAKLMLWTKAYSAAIHEDREDDVFVLVAGFEARFTDVAVENGRIAFIICTLGADTSSSLWLIDTRVSAWPPHLQLVDHDVTRRSEVLVERIEMDSLAIYVTGQAWGADRRNLAMGRYQLATYESLLDGGLTATSARRGPAQ